MTGEVIKSFLVGLGFDVDDASLSKFNKAVTSASVKVAALYGGIQIAAAGIFAGISKISEGFEDMGYELRLVAPAMNKMLLLRREMLLAYSRAGIDLTKVVKQSIAFNFSLAKTKFALEAVYKSVGARFLPLLTKQMDVFRKGIYANMPKIQEQLMKFVNFLFKAFNATVILGVRVWSILGRVWDFFKELDTATAGWSTKILLAIAAWKLLNLEFLATPLGMILTGLLAILALYDDFKVWQEGGKSFFDWSSFVPVINSVKDALVTVWNVLGNISQVVFGLIEAFARLFTLDFQGLKFTMENVFGSVGDSIAGLIGLFKNFVGLFDALGNWTGKLGGGKGLSGLFGDTIGGNSAAPALSSALQPNPTINNTNGGNSQKVNQQTNINIQGSADAGSVGKAVASEQSKVNFDMSRNLKGAMR